MGADWYVYRGKDFLAGIGMGAGLDLSRYMSAEDIAPYPAHCFTDYEVFRESSENRDEFNLLGICPVTVDFNKAEAEFAKLIEKLLAAFLRTALPDRNTQPLFSLWLLWAMCREAQRQGADKIQYDN